MDILNSSAKLERTRIRVSPEENAYATADHKRERAAFPWREGEESLVDAADERVWAVTVNPHSMMASEFRRSRLPSAKISNRARRTDVGDWNAVIGRRRKRKTGSVYILGGSLLDDRGKNAVYSRLLSLAAVGGKLRFEPGRA